MDEKKGGRRARLLLRTAAVLLAVGALGALLHSGLLRDVRSVDELRGIIARAGKLAWLTFFLLQMTTVILAPLPSNAVMLAGSLALGFRVAFPLGMAAIFCGSMVAFAAARRLGRSAVRRLVDRTVLERYLPLIEEKEDMFLFLTLLFPFFPDDMLCILAGLTDIPASRFALLLVLARPWGLAFAAMLGGGRVHLPAWGWGALFVALSAAFYVMMKYSARIEGALLRLVKRATRRRKRP